VRFFLSKIKIGDREMMKKISAPEFSPICEICNHHRSSKHHKARQKQCAAEWKKRNEKKQVK
jgi:hypothetical protein